VTLHIDPQHTAIPARAVIVPDWHSYYALSSGFDDPVGTGPYAVRFSDLQARYFHPNSNHPWHYAVFGNYVFTDSPLDSVNCPPTADEPGFHRPQPGMTGDSQVGFLDVPGFGYSFVVALQGIRDAGIDLSAPANARYEAATFMHELGHNLGLCHGGPNLDGGCDSAPGQSGENYKPNYISVMNYNFEFGIPFASTPGSTAVTGWRVDYSDVKLPDLDETCLDETVGVQDIAHPTDITKGYLPQSFPALGPVDWSNDGTTTDSCVPRSLLAPFSGAPHVLRGADDWAWLHSRLTPPAITDLSGYTPTRSGDDIRINGFNLYLRATVVFAGGASTVVGNGLFGVGAPLISGFAVTVPDGAKSGPVTVLTADGKATSRQSLTITPWRHGGVQRLGRAGRTCAVRSHPHPPRHRGPGTASTSSPPVGTGS
jgi:hypothetical protein